MGVDPVSDDALRRRTYIEGQMQSLQGAFQNLPEPDMRHQLEISKYDALAMTELQNFRVRATEDISSTLNKLYQLFEVTKTLRETYKESRESEYAEYNRIMVVLCEEFYHGVVSSSEEHAPLPESIIAKYLNHDQNPSEMVDTAEQDRAKSSVSDIAPYATPPNPVNQDTNSLCKSPASYQATQNAHTTISLEDDHPVIVATANAPTRSSQIPSENGTAGPSKRRASKSSESASKRQRTRRTVEFREIHQPQRWETMPRILSKPTRNSTTFYILRCEEHPDVTFSHVRPIQMGNQHLRTEHGVEAEMNKNPGKNLAYERLAVEVLGCSEELFVHHNAILDREIQKDVDRPIDQSISSVERNTGVFSSINGTVSTSNQQLTAEMPVTENNEQIQCPSSAQGPEENANGALSDSMDESSESDAMDDEFYFNEVDDENDPDWEDNSPTPTGDPMDSSGPRYRTPARTRRRTARESLVVTLQIPRDRQQQGDRVAANQEQIVPPTEGPFVKQESAVFPWADPMTLDDEDQVQANVKSPKDQIRPREPGFGEASAQTAGTHTTRILTESSVTCVASAAMPHLNQHTSLSFSPIDVPPLAGGHMLNQSWSTQYEIERRPTQHLMERMNRPPAPVAEMSLE